VVLKKKVRESESTIGRWGHFLLISVYLYIYCLTVLSGLVYNANMIDRQLSEYFAAMGRKSAKVRMRTISARRRKQIARNAAKARWAKQKRKG
jgi:hypothetical protein